jgi:hypothetical protein
MAEAALNMIILPLPKLSFSGALLGHYITTKLTDTFEIGYDTAKYNLFFTIR